MAASKIGQVVAFVIAVVFALAATPACNAQALDDLPLEDWKQLREVERYQLQIAEKYWREQNWKTAAAEYEKFIELYEESHGAPYAQLKWSLAQVKLRKQNTAIKEGFQTVIDYWPESPQAIAAAFYIGRTQKEIGRVKEAKASLKSVATKHPEHLAAVFALSDLAAIAGDEKDTAALVDTWKRLTFDVKRSPHSAPTCVQASQQLAVHYFRAGAFADGVKSLATTYDAAQLPPHVAQFVRTPVSELSAQAETKAKGAKLADQAIAWFKQKTPADRSTDESKLLARQTLFAIADITALAVRDDQVPAAYEAILQAFPGEEEAATRDDALGRLAAWYKSKTNFDKARETYRRYSNSHEGLGQVAYSFREQQNYQSAVEVYQQLIVADADGKIRWKSELAATLRALSKWPEAIAVYEELYKDDAENPSRWRWEVASTHRDAGQLKEAIGHFRQCTNFPENYKQMAACHRQLKQYGEAVTLYNQVAAGDKGSAPWAMLQVAYTREQAGEKEPAIAAFQQVCKRFPKDGHASIAHAHLQQAYNISVTLGGAAEE
jgi:tetratricopeptide (TPR) repeat protein